MYGKGSRGLFAESAGMYTLALDMCFKLNGLLHNPTLHNSGYGQPISSLIGLSH